MYFIRHGFSCGNIKHELDKLPSEIKNKTLKLKNFDPYLSKVGINQSSYYGSKLRKKMIPSVVLCSSMNRAIQTALHMFPNSEIIVIPYIKEIGTSHESICTDLKTKKESLKVMYPRKFQQLNFKFITDNNINSLSFNKFKSFINRKFPKNMHKNMCVVTHSMYMIEHLNVPKNPFPRNNVVYYLKSFNNSALKHSEGASVKPLSYPNISNCVH